jgi:hypothetical protein
MKGARRRLCAGIVVLLCCAMAWFAASPSTAFAQAPQPAASASAAPSGSAASDSSLEDAKRLFRQGNELRRAGDCQKALEFFVRSRAIVPSMQNTLNSAICLDQIGRFDEALEMYEDVLTKFGEQLDTDSKQAMAPSMAALRRKVGTIEVSANVEGSLIIDARMRGKLPILSPVRVMPGPHVVRVVKDGYETFEKSVVVKAGESTAVDAKLAPLASAGRLRIEDKALEGGELFVDGAMVGKLPWEGTLAPGDRLFWVRKGDIGSAPRKATVVQGQTVLAQVVAGPLGPDMRIVLEPATAQMYIDGVLVGKGTWQGRLPIGKHTIDARELGYFALTHPMVVAAETRGDAKLALKADKAHPRWGVAAPSGRFTLDLLGGAALSNSFGSSAETQCSSGNCASRSIPLGFIAGARGGYELPMGLGFEVGGGYMSMTAKVERNVNESFSTPAVEKLKLPAGTANSEYTINETLRVRGPVAFAGVTYRRGLGAIFEAQGRVDIGVWIASFSDTLSGTATSGGVTRDVSVSGSGKTGHAAPVFVMPGIDLFVKKGHWRVGVGLSAAIFLTDGPTLNTGNAHVRAQTCNPEVNRDSIDCAPDESFTRSEKAYGRFVAFMPQASVGYVF